MAATLISRLLPDDKREIFARISSLISSSPGSTAIEQGRRRLTYGELGGALDERMRALSGSITCGDLVAIECPRSIEYVLDFLAVFGLGGIPVPLDPSLPQGRRDRLLEQLPAHLRVRGGVVTGAGSARARLPGDGAYVFFTSGSTGLPKPVLGSARGLRSFVSWQCAEFAVDAGDRVAFLTPLGFDVSLRDMLLPLWAGGTLVIPGEGEADSPESVVAWLQRRAITIVHVVPSVARAWLRYGRTACSSLRVVFFAGEPLAARLLRDWFSLFPATRVQANLYGPTETTLAKFWHRVQPGDREVDPVPVGGPMPGTWACLLDEVDHFNAATVRRRMGCPVGEGEIVIVTRHASHGYLGSQAATRERFCDLGGGLIAYRTGDLGRRSGDGRLVVIGRTDDEVKIDGVRIHPAEVATALRARPDLRDVFVLPVPVPVPVQGSRYQLMAFLVMAGSSAVSEPELRDWLADRVPRAMLPARFIMVSELPTTPNGKVDRAGLLERARSMGAGASFTEPSGDIELWLAGVWADLLSVERVSATEDFLRLGGTSIFAMQLVARIRAKFQLELPIRTVFAQATVRALATEISGRVSPAGADDGMRISVADRSTGRLAMSFAQRRLYFLQALNPASAAYNIAEAVHLRGPIDVDRLRQSLRAVVGRHEVLRTICVHDRDEPELVIADEAAIDRDVDVTTVDGRGSDLAAHLAGLTEVPFQLDARLPLRATLVRLGTDDHVLLFVTHHIASDEWSSRLFLREFFATYAAGGDGPPPPIQYGDFAAWERNQLSDDVLHRQMDYWRERLDGMPPMDLPGLEPPSDNRTDRAAELEFSIDEGLSRRLRAVARHASVTPFAVLLAAFGYVLHRHCATDDVSVGSPVAVRTQPELEDMLGCFINTLVFRLDFAGSPSCRELLEQTGRCVLGAVEHRDLPYERLVAELRPERDRSGGQLLRAMFNHHEAISVEAAGCPFEAERLALPKPGAQFDLSCHVVDHGETMAAHLVYAVDLLSADFAKRLGEHLIEVLDALSADLDAPMTRLPALPRADAEWLASREAVPGDGEPSLPITRFEAHAAADPGRTAVRCLEDVADYGELNRCANQLARHLLARGIECGDIVALHYERSVELVVAMLAVQKAGAAYVPLDPVFPAGHIAAILGESKAKLVLTHQAVDPAGLASVTKTGIVVVDEIADVLAAYPAVNLDRPISPDAAIYVLFTSGSTGRPKGVVVEHRNLANFLDGMLPRMALPDHLSFANVTTFAADLGLTNVYGALTTGGTLHVIPYAMATDPELLAGYFRRHPIDFMKSVPSHLQAMSEAGVLHSIVPSRYLVLAGEAFPWDLAERIRQVRPQCEIWNHYGPTETTVDVLAYRVAKERIGGTVPIGFPIDQVQAHIVDRGLRPVPVGTRGELLIGGASVARGYLSSDGRAGDAFIADPYSALSGARAYRTGDKVRMLSGGAVEFLGRIDSQTKIRGYRVEPGHVEATLRGHPVVADATVAVRKDAQGQATLVAYFVPRRDSAESSPSRTLREHARSELPPYMVPAAFVPLERLPITPNGKLDRGALPAPDLATGDDRTLVPPRHATDRRIMEIWQAALGVRALGIDDDFFDLGGNSLLAMRVVREVGAGLRVISLFQHPTVRLLADFVDAATPGQGGNRLLYRMSGATRAVATTTIVAVPFGGGSAASYHDLAKALPAELPLYAIELPGHDYGNAAQPLEAFDAVVERAVTEIRQTISGRIVVYGHCVGSAMACAIAHRLDAEGGDVVGVCFGGAYPSPHLPGRFFDLWSRIMPSDRWRADRLYAEMLRTIGGFTDAVDPAEQAFIVRALRHDSRGADRYFSHHDGEPRLAALCVVGAGDRLTEFHQERHREWKQLCATTDLAVIPDAGHYFVKYQAGELAKILAAWIEKRRTATTPPPREPAAALAPAPGPADGVSLTRFALVSLSQLLSMTGTRVSAFGLGMWVYLETGSATLFSFILVCAVFPGLLALPIAGAVVDRWDRRLVMIASDLVGVSGTGLCLMLHAFGALQIWHIYLAASLGAVANAFQQPAYIAATAQLVPKQYLARVSGVIQAIVALSQTAGPLLGAVLILYLGVGGVLAIDVATLCASVVTLAVIRFPNTLFRKREEPVWKEIVGGFQYIARRPGFVAMNAYFLAYNLLLGFVIALAPPMVLSFASAGTLGLATTMGGIGGVLGGLAMALWGGFERRATGMVGFCLLTGAGMIVAGLRPAPLCPILGLAAIGASIALLNGHWQTLIQNKVGTELQGRMITTNRMIANLSEPVGYFCAGWLADVLFEPAMRPGGWLAETAGPLVGTGPGRGMALMIVVLGLAQIAVAVIGLRWRTLRYMEDALPDAVPGAIVTWDRDRLQQEADELLSISPSPAR